MARRVIYILSFISTFFVVLIFVYFRNTQKIKNPPIEEKTLAEVPVKEEFFKEEREIDISWMGIYIKGEKVGYTYTKEIETENGYEIEQRMLVELLMLGEKKRLTATTFVNTDKNFVLREFDFMLFSIDQEFKMKGKREKDSLKVTLFSPAGKQNISFYLGENAFLPVTLEAFVKEKKLKEKKKISFKMFDPSVMQLSELTVSYLGKDEIEIENKRYETELYEYTFAGTVSKIWVDEKGVVRETGPFDMEIIRETQENAIKIPGTPLDLLFKFAVLPEGKPVKGSPKEVIMKLYEIDHNILDLNFATQEIIREEEEYVIIKNSIPEIGKETGSLPEEVKKFLAPGPFVQSEHPKIKSLAKEWTQGIKDPVEISKVLVEKVYNYLEKSPTVTVPSALQVLELKKGDCNEHSVLYAALARSMGIPTEIVVGLIYQAGYFYYHAWDAVYLNGKWIFVDPTYNEFPASPLHILLKKGGIDKQAEVAPVVGKIRIEIIETQ